MPSMRPGAAAVPVLLAALCALPAAACSGGPGPQGAPGPEAGVTWSDEMEDGSGITALAAGPGGSVYAAGWTTLALSAGAGRGGRDCFVRRYSADGDVLWTRQFGAPGDDNAEDLAVDPAGNVYVAARIDGPTGAEGGGRDGLVAGFSPDGTELWSLRIGTDAVDWADAVAVTASGDVFASGSTTGAFPGHRNRGSTDNFLARIGPDGELAWVVQFGSEEGMGATSLAVSHRRLYMAGSTLGPLSESPAGDEHAGSADLFLRAHDDAGAELWTWTFGSNHADSALGLSADDAGGIVVVGTTRAVLPNPVVGIGSRAGGFLDAFAIGLDAGGVVEWVSQFGTGEWDVASSVARGRDGTLYVAGRTNGSFPGHRARGGFDVFVRAMESGGRALWTRQMGSAVADLAYAVAAVPGGGLYLGGSGGVASAGEPAAERGWIIRMEVPDG